MKISDRDLDTLRFARKQWGNEYKLLMVGGSLYGFDVARLRRLGLLKLEAKVSCDDDGRRGPGYALTAKAHRLLRDLDEASLAECLAEIHALWEPGNQRDLMLHAAVELWST